MPTAVGAKPTVSVVVLPGARVSAPENPLMVNPVPDTVACEIVTEPVPLFVSDTDCVEEVPSSALAKVRLPVLLDSRYVRAVVDVLPLPFTGRETLYVSPLEDFMLITMSPL